MENIELVTEQLSAQREGRDHNLALFVSLLHAKITVRSAAMLLIHLLNKPFLSFHQKLEHFYISYYS